MTDVTSQPDPAQTPMSLPAYHTALLDYLQRQQHELWDWFESQPIRSQHADSVRLALLRSAFRIDRESHDTLYRIADDVAGAMSMNLPVILYQAQNPQQLSASLAWLPEEAHIVLYGDLQDLLLEHELAAVIAHELAHHELLAARNSAFLNVTQVLNAMMADRSGSTSHDRTWRAFQMYTELYCDRRALEVCGSLEHVVSALVKLDTGVKDISADAYLAQAAELLSKHTSESEGITHPEMYLRVHALASWQADPTSTDTVMRPLIEGPLQLKSLDLLRQEQLAHFTEQFLRDFLQPVWLQTRVMQGYLRRLFPEFAWHRDPADDLRDTGLTLADVRSDPDLERYVCYLLLDCVTADPDLEDAPLAAAFLFADQHDLNDVFEPMAQKELRLGKRHFRRIRNEAQEIAAAAEEGLTK